MEIWINIIGGTVILVISAIVVYLKGDQSDSRGKEITAIARSLGVHYRACDAWVDSAAFLHLDVFRRGWDHITLHTCSDVRQINGRPHPIRMGDFEYTVGEGDKERSYRFSYLLVQLPYPGVPDLLIRPEGVMDRLTETVKAEAVDIDFESSEFNRRFHVECESRRFAFDLINPRMMERLLEGRACRIEVARGFMVVSDGSTLWSPEQFREQFLHATRLLECWPTHLADSPERGR